MHSIPDGQVVLSRPLAEPIDAFLRQTPEETTPLSATVERLAALVAD